MRIVLISVFVLLLISLYRFAIKGKFGRFPGSGFGNAVSQVHTLLRPSAENIVEAKKQHRENANQGDDKPPELPPWAQSGK
jgi:hypothetical protein